jgi:hypothetical protein
MSENQFIVSLFDKKFISEEVIEESGYSTSLSNTTSNSSPQTNNSINNNILFVNNQPQPGLLLSGKQFWPTSTPIRDDYIIISNNSKFGSTFTSISPVKKLFYKIWSRMNPNEILKRNSNSPSSTSSEDYYLLSHLNQHDNCHNEYLRTHKKIYCSPNTSSLAREKKIHKKQSSNLLKKKIPPMQRNSPVKTSNYFCYDDMFNKRNPISPPINPVAVSRNQSMSYTSRHNLNPLLTPDERTTKPLRSVLFNIHTYWQNWSVKYQTELPRNISFHRFKRVMSQILRYEIPNDLIVLYHTKRYTDDDVMIRFDSKNEEINRFLLEYLCKSDKVRVVTHDAIWSTYLLMWNDDEISITLFSKSLIERN